MSGPDKKTAASPEAAIDEKNSESTNAHAHVENTSITGENQEHGGNGLTCPACGKSVTTFSDNSFWCESCATSWPSANDFERDRARRDPPREDGPERKTHRVDTSALKARLRLSAVFAVYGHTVDASGMIRCPWHEDSTPSLHVDDEKGLFKCHGCGLGGDHITAIQKFEGRGFREALVKLQELAGGEIASLGGNGSKRVAPKEGWVPIAADLDSFPPPMSHPALGKPDIAFAYRNAEGQVLGLVYRWEAKKGRRKEIRQLTHCVNASGQRAWRWQGMKAPRFPWGTELLGRIPGPRS